MGRHKSMKPALDAGPITAVRATTLLPLAVTATVSTRRAPRPKLEADSAARHEPSARLASLLNYRPRMKISKAVIEAAAELIMQTPMISTTEDRSLMGELCRLLKFDTDNHGGHLDVKRALRPSVIDHYLGQVRAGRTAGGLNTLRLRLYRVGRLLDPLAFPEPRLTLPRPKEALAPDTSENIRRLYAKARTASPALRRKMFFVLDLATGAGARASEIRALRACDIARAEQDPVIAVVTLKSDTSKAMREVPVMDVDKSARLLALAASATDPWAPLVPMGERGGVHSVQTELRKRSPALSFSAVRLRHWWIVDLSNKNVPAAMVYQLADLNDSHTIATLRRYMNTYQPATALEILKAATK